MINWPIFGLSYNDIKKGCEMVGIPAVCVSMSTLYSLGGVS